MALCSALRRVRSSGLRVQLVVPVEIETSLTEAGLQKQFARTPYAIACNPASEHAGLPA